MGIFIPILFTLIGGSFFFGKYVGESKFNNEKNDLFESNKLLNFKNDSLRKEIRIQKKEINSVLLKFTGIEGISKSEKGDFNLHELKVNTGDRFFIKSNALIQDGIKTIGVNVLNTTIDIELEMFPTTL